MTPPQASSLILVETIGHTKWAEPIDDKKAVRIIRKIKQLADTADDEWWIASQIMAVCSVARRKADEARERRLRRAA